MSRLSNSKLRKRGLRGCRVRSTVDRDGAVQGLDVARRSGDRRSVEKLRRFLREA